MNANPMKWFEATIAYLFPTILVDNTPWRTLWEEQQREQFLRVSRFLFPAVAAGYIVHFYVFDVPMGLEPIEFWFKFRMTIAGLALTAFVFYISPLTRIRLYKLPAIVAYFAICYSQAKVATWYGKEAWFFFFLFVLATIMLLRMSSLKSAAYGLLVVSASAPLLTESGVPIENIVSGTLVTLGLAVVVRTSTLTEVRNFLLNQENTTNQRRMIEMNIEFADRIKSFIPRVIANRLTSLMDEHRLSIVEASVEALKAKRRDIACLFTDIRGFTQGSKDMDRFINESVMPEVNACSRKIEDLEGIPRKIGDLLFAYFDSSSIHLNILRAMLAGIEVARINESMNATSAAIRIRRYILISSGEAMVGNFGGLDSSIEITALGTPVNFLSRVDDLTKAEGISNMISHGDLILCERTVSIVEQLNVDLPFQRIDLKKLHLEVRDFPEADAIYKLTPTDDTYEFLLEVYRASLEAFGDRHNRRQNGTRQE